jgi:N6-L-threonylcarbamoyladenine synthase
MRDLVLGIESSCDDTAAALVDAKGTVVASVKVMQTEIHRPHGGVYPELASRAHVAAILPALDKALVDAGIGPDRIRAIGVTRGPGLIGPLLVGLNTAAGLGMGWDLPVIGVNHLRGHLRSADLEESRVKYPATILLVSGGHTILAYMENPSSIRLLGATRDDSVGEAYDKVGRMLGLGYPGGPPVDRLAKTGETCIQFPRPMLNEGLVFSLSGLKSAVSRYLESEPHPSYENVAASFVQAILDLLVVKCRRALAENRSASLVIVGGVAASPQIRSAASELCQEMGVDLCLPPLRWATDNAAMIALATWDYIRANQQPRPVPEIRLSILDY